MYGIKKPGDGKMLVLFLLSLAGFIYLLTQSWLWLLFAPVYWFLTTMGSLYLVTGKIPQGTRAPMKELGIVIKTTLLTVGGDRKACDVIVRESEIVVKSRGIADIHIAMERLTALMFEDKSTPEMSMAGFGIDYVDRGPARLMFFNDSWFPVHNTRKAVSLIQNAHHAYFKGCDVAPLNFIDVSTLKKQAANSAVHRIH